MIQEPCIFCSIIAGGVPAQLVEQDEYTVAFMDINPWSRGHTLVVPREHIRDLHEIGPDDLWHVMLAAQRVTGRMLARLGCERVVLWNSAGAAAGQLIFHFHVHLIPRYEPDSAEDIRGPSAADADELAAIAAQLTA